MKDKHAEEAGQRNPEDRRPEAPSHIHTKNHFQDQIGQHEHNGEFLNGKIQGQEVQLALDGQTQRDQPPAAIAQPINK